MNEIAGVRPNKRHGQAYSGVDDTALLVLSEWGGATVSAEMLG